MYVALQSTSQVQHLGFQALQDLHEETGYYIESSFNNIHVGFDRKSDAKLNLITTTSFGDGTMRTKCSCR